MFAVIGVQLFKVGNLIIIFGFIIYNHLIHTHTYTHTYTNHNSLWLSQCENLLSSHIWKPFSACSLMVAKRKNFFTKIIFYLVVLLS